MAKILCVDDEPNNLQILRQILKDSYKLIFAPNGTKALNIVYSHRPDLILLDVMMPDISGYEVCEKLKADPSTADIPVIFITAMGEVGDEARGFDVGAVDYIQKPVSAPVVLRRVKTHLSLVHTKELESSQKNAVFMLGEAGHFNDCDTGAHIWRMAAYARALAKAAGWSDQLVERLALAAPMHDTGKIGTPDSILKAPRELTAEEWMVMQAHTKVGYEILKNSNSPIFKMAAEIALYHHEKWDGSGYPYGLSKEGIPESARIVAIADVFDALTMKRPYKEPWCFEDAMAEINRGAGNHFDPRLVDLFKENLLQIKQIKEIWDQKELQDKEKPQIMVVDDDEHFREVIVLLLQSLGLRVKYSLESGEKAIELLKDNAIELIFLDIIMPGMSGFETLRKIMEVKPQMKVIMLTGMDDDISHKQCIEMGARDYLVKGGDPTMIANAIEMLITKL